MPTTFPATWNTTTGAWFASLNWDEPDPNDNNNTLHYVPDATSDVSIPDHNGGNPFTITYNGADTINSLVGVANATLDMTGGSLTVNASGLSAININVEAPATLSVATGAELTIGGGTLTGSISGAGTLTLRTGDTAINTASVTISTLKIEGGNQPQLATLGVDLTYANTFIMDGQFDAFNLGGHTLTLSGSSTFSIPHGDGINNGALTITGTSTFADFTVGGGATTGASIEVASGGSVSQTASLFLHGSLVIDSGGSYTITGLAPSNIVDGGSAIITNNGTLTDSIAGTSQISGTFTNNNSLVIGTGATLALLFGSTDALGGSISGAGTLQIGFGTNATLSSTTLTVGAITLNGGNGGATLTLGGDKTYAGALSFANQFDTLALNGHTLTLSGTSNSLAGGNSITGAGTLKVTGSSNLGTSVSSATVESAGAITQTGGTSLDGASQLIVDAGHTYTIANSSNLSGSGTVTNNGTLTMNSVNGGHSSTLAGTFTNNGTLSVVSGDTLLLDGTDTLKGSITGAGTLHLHFSSTTIDTPTISVATLLMSGGNGGTGVTLAQDVTTSGKFSMTGQFDVLDLGGHIFTINGAGTTIPTGVVQNGTLKIGGTATLSGGSYGNTGAATIEDAGSITQDANFNLHGALQVDNGATYTMINNARIIDSGGVTTTVAGTLKVGDTSHSRIDGSVVDNGTIEIQSGTSLYLPGAVSGAGVLQIDSNGLLELSGGIGGSVAVHFAGTDGTLFLDSATTLASTIFGFTTNDKIDLFALSYQATYHAVWAGGTVSIEDSANSNDVVASFSLQGPYGDASFNVASDGSGGTLLLGTGISGVPTPNDFDGDSQGDILWRNTSNGVNAVWEMNPAGIKSFFSVPTVDTSYKPAGTADFDGDGHSDILWRNSSGVNAVWEMTDGGIKNYDSIPSVDPNYKVEALGDFDGDGHADILWRNTTSGVDVVWEMNGPTIKSYSLVPTVDTSYKVAGIGDFDGDGKSDILWRNSGGGNIVWEMDGGAIKSFLNIPTVNTTYSVAVIGDFDGDGKSDILWRDTSGGNVVWEMNGTGIKTSYNILTVDPSYQAEQITDFDKDGKSDILWHSQTNGAVAVWEMNGGTINSYFALPTVDPSYHAMGTHFDLI